MPAQLLCELLNGKGRFKPRDNDLHNLCNYSRGGCEYAALSQLTSRETRSFDLSLTTILNNHNVQVGAIKAAQNHSWRFGWNLATSYSIESCSFMSTVDNLKKLFTLLPPEKGNNCYLIDMDLMHGGLFFANATEFAQNDDKDELDWRYGYESSRENFMGLVSDDRRLKDNYLSKLMTFDRHLNDLLDVIPDDSNIILWSDHGWFYPFNAKNLPINIPQNSGAKIEKIWKPTLLVSTTSMASDELPSRSDELVSTTDLYSIVLSLCGAQIPTQKNNSFLPPSLGGDYKRKISLTFGAAYDSTKDQTKVKSLRPSRWDLIARYMP